MSVKGPSALRIADVAAAVGGSLVGDPETVVSGIAPLDRAGPGDVTFLASARYASMLASSNAGAVLVSPQLADTPGTCRSRIVVDKPHEAMLTLLPLLYTMPDRPFAGVHPSAVVASTAVIAPDACVEAFSVVGAGARIAAGAWIGPFSHVSDGVVVGPGSRLVSHVTLYEGTRIGARTTLHAGTRIGSDGFGYVSGKDGHRKVPHVGRCEIGDDVEMGANCTIDRGSLDATEIGDGCKFDNMVHVGHNCRVGRLCLFTAGTMVAGSTNIGDGVVLAGQVGVAGHVNIGSGAILTARAGVISDVPAGETWGGFPARPHKLAMRGYGALAKLPDFMKRVEQFMKDRRDS